MFLKMFNNFFCLQKVEKPAWKSCLLMAVGSFFFLCIPDCLKQSRTSFSFYEFFFTTILCRISARKSSLSRWFTFWKIKHFLGLIKNIDLILWHTQLIVYAVKCSIMDLLMGYFFYFSTLLCPIHIWILKQLTTIDV